MDSKIVDDLVDILGSDWVVSDKSQIGNYLMDETEELMRPKSSENSVVVKPGDTEEVSKVMKYANDNLISVVPRGGGTGLCGAAIPTEDSIILSLERLNEIEEVDDDNLMVTCQAGVTLADLIERLEDHDKLYFPLHPGDEGAHVGGMVMENAGGVRAVKHGVMREYVKGLEVVLPNGEVINLGGKLLKDNAGYDLMHLLIGSEGTLGVVTKVNLRLYVEPGYSSTLLLSFDSSKDALDVVPKILQEGVRPLAVEYVPRELALKSAEHLGKSWPASDGEVDLMIILSEEDEDDVLEMAMDIEEIAKDFGVVNTLFAEREEDQENILDIRSNIYEAIEENISDTLDAAVPPASLPEFIERSREIAEGYGTSISCNGHPADGNLHINIPREDGGKPSYLDDLKEDLYELTLDLGGTVTGEHGIGKTRKKELLMQFSESEIEIMRGIKRAFDPNNILNPGTIFDGS